MMDFACTAVAWAALVATTASADETAAEQLLLVAGWLTTATDLVHQAVFLAAVGSEIDVLL